MSILDFIFKLFMGQAPKAFDPAEIGQQILAEIKKMLQSLIVLTVLSVVFCILTAHFITRTLDLLDKGNFYFSHSILLLLALMVIDLFAIAYVLKKATQEENQQTSRNNQRISSNESTTSPLEGAIAALIIDFVKQREVAREVEREVLKQTSKTTEPPPT